MNSIIERHKISSLIDLGCGDGNQIRGLSGVEYTGVDVSESAVRRCQELFADDSSKRFLTTNDLSNETAELAISLDVIYHLVEDDIFEVYMQQLFDAAKRMVLIYSSDMTQLCLNPFASPTHVRHRKFSEWIEFHRPNWRMEKRIENPHKKTTQASSDKHSYADFFLYQRG